MCSINQTLLLVEVNILVFNLLGNQGICDDEGKEDEDNPEQSVLNKEIVYCNGFLVFLVKLKSSLNPTVQN